MQNSSINTCNKVSRSLLIPKRTKYLNESDLPNDYCKTPGGTLYSTTPGGTRIIYERELLINLRSSPLSKTPPRNLPNIPGLTKDIEPNLNNKTKTILNDHNDKLIKNKELLKLSNKEELIETDFEIEL